jgi:hypothetical protein
MNKLVIKGITVAASLVIGFVAYDVGKFIVTKTVEGITKVKKAGERV